MSVRFGQFGDSARGRFAGLRAAIVAAAWLSACGPAALIGTRVYTVDSSTVDPSASDRSLEADDAINRTHDTPAAAHSDEAASLSGTTRRLGRATEHGVGHGAPEEPAQARSRTRANREPVQAEQRVLRRGAAHGPPGEARVSLPYDTSNIISTFSDCRRGGRTHAGLDMGGVGPNEGLGTPVRAMVRSRITLIGRPEESPARYGEPDLRRGYATRGRRDVQLPRSEDVPGYGEVHYFTRNYGSWHSGTVIVMEGLEAPLEGHRIRYMHLGAVHPELRVGDIVEAGQEVGLMGGTAVMTDLPHVHIDIETPSERRVDVAPLLGLPGDRGRCRE